MRHRRQQRRRARTHDARIFFEKLRRIARLGRAGYAPETTIALRSLRDLPEIGGSLMIADIGDGADTEVVISLEGPSILHAAYPTWRASQMLRTTWDSIDGVRAERER